MKLEVIRRLFKEALDRGAYDLAYTLQLWMAGDFDAIERAIDGKVIQASWEGSEGELASYPEIAPQLGPMGLQNHGFVNASINIQGIEMGPDFLFEHPDSVIRSYNAAWIRHRWTTQKWQDQFYQTGIEVEANGMSACMAGLSKGAVSWRHSPFLDTVVDGFNKSPSNYRWVCRRFRHTPEEIERIYGDALSQDDMDMLTTERENCVGTMASSDHFGSERRNPAKQIIEWCWYSEEFHVVFLGSMCGENSIPLVLDKNYQYRKVPKSGGENSKSTDNGTAGPNPFGVIPFAFWIGAWAPSQKRPAGKSMTVIRLTAMLNTVERFMVETMNNGVPLTTINVNAVADRAMVDDIMAAKGWTALRKIIPTKGSMKNILERTPAADLPVVCLHLRQVLKEEINAATGVQDMMRGQALSGEKTKYEVQSLNDQAGIQGRYLRKQYASFVEDVIHVSRVIGAQHETAVSTLVLPDFGAISTADYPVEPMLREHIPVRVSPENLIFKTEDQRKQEAMVELDGFVLKLQGMGAPIDPKRVLAKFGPKFGYRDAVGELCFTPEEIAQQQAQMMQEQAMSSQVAQSPA